MSSTEEVPPISDSITQAGADERTLIIDAKIKTLPLAVCVFSLPAEQTTYPLRFSIGDSVEE